jgi:hypothetical protein
MHNGLFEPEIFIVKAINLQLLQSYMLSDAPLSGRPLALPTNIRLGWKGLPRTKTLVYYENSKITAVNSFIVQATVNQATV